MNDKITHLEGIIESLLLFTEHKTQFEDIDKEIYGLLLA